MENNDYNRLDEFFKKHLNGNFPQERWNTPSDDLFENAMKRVNIPKDPSNGRGLPFLLPFLLMSLVAGIGGFVAFNNYRINQNLTAQIKANTQELETLKASFSTLANLQNNTYNTKTDVAQQQNVANMQQANTTSPQFFNTSKRTSIAGSFAEEAIVATEEASLPVVEPTSKTSPITSFENISGLPSISYRQVSSNDQVQPPVMASVLTTEKVKPVSTWSGMVYAGINSSKMKMSPMSKKMAGSLSGLDHRHQSMSLGLEVAKQITPKISLTSKFSFNTIAANCSLKDEMMVDMQNVYTSDSGEKIYMTNIALDNVINATNPMVSFRVDDLMNEGEMIQKNAQISHKFSTSQIDLGLKYKVFEGNKLGFSVGMSAGGGLITNVRNLYGVDLTYNNNAMYSIDMDDTKSLLKKGYLQVGASTEASLKMTPHTEIVMGLQYNQVLSSIRKPSINMDSNTTFNSANVTLGARYLW